MNNIKIYKDSYVHKLCYVLKEGEKGSLIVYAEKDSITKYSFSRPSNINNIRIIDIGELDNIIEQINNDTDNKIFELKSKLKSTKTSDYPKDYDIKKRIQKVAMNISKCDIECEDETFENNLKEIYQLKKQLYGDKNIDVSKARKHNGIIKHKIKEVELDRQNKLKYLDIDIIKGLLE